jgi:hypothetical protein
MKYLYHWTAYPDLRSYRAFACTGPSKAFEMVSALTADYNPTIEDDQVVSVAA